MVAIATLPELASFLQTDLDTATANLLLVDLAQGLITEVIGDRNPWPSVAKSVALAAAGRSYRNPNGLRQQTVGGTTSGFNAEEMGVYLASSELERLNRWNRENGGVRGAPTGAFPEASKWPDPADWFNWLGWGNSL
jgi:hypothetical protein